MTILLLSEIAAGTKGRLLGDDHPISALRRIGDAESGQLGVVLRPQDFRFLPACRASAVLLSVSEAADCLDRLSCSAVVVDAPFLAIDLILRALNSRVPDLEFGNGCEIHPSAVIKPGTRLGNRVKIGAHCVIGADGFVFYDGPNGPIRMPHYYGVHIEDDVELGSHVCVDQGMLAPTRIGARTKIDNFVQVAHDVTIGSDCIIVAQSGIAGHTRIGSRVNIGGQAGIGPYLVVGDGAQISARSALFSDIGEGEIWSGSPAMPHMDFLRASAAFKKLARTKHGTSKEPPHTSHGLSRHHQDIAPSIPLLDDRSSP